MKIQRTIPPTAAPVRLGDFLRGLAGLFCGNRYFQKLESELKTDLGVNHLFFVSSGKAALTLILSSLKTLSPRRQVVIPAYTCFSVPAAVIRAGLEVRLCDIDPKTFCFNDAQLQKTVNEETLCVVPTHLFGIPAEMDRINDLCRKRGIFVVEDAAQAMGGVDHDRKLGTLGDVGFFSLGRGKNITCGTGGIVVTNSDRIAEAISIVYRGLPSPMLAETVKEWVQLLLMKFFIHPAVYWLPAGMLFLKLGETIYDEDFPVKRLSGVKAGLLQTWQDRLAESNKARVENALFFMELLKQRGWKGVPEDRNPYLRLPLFAENSDERNMIYFFARRQGLGVSLMYPMPINEISEFADVFQGEHFPSAKWVAERLITLPTHGLLSERDRCRIGDLFHQIIESIEGRGRDLENSALNRKESGKVRSVTRIYKHESDEFLI